MRELFILLCPFIIEWIFSAMSKINKYVLIYDFCGFELTNPYQLFPTTLQSPPKIFSFITVIAYNLIHSILYNIIY